MTDIRTDERSRFASSAVRLGGGASPLDAAARERAISSSLSLRRDDDGRDRRRGDGGAPVASGGAPVTACRYAAAPTHECYPTDGLCNSGAAAREIKREPSPGATGIGALALVDVGWSVWSREKDAETKLARFGGTVVAVVNKIDDDTGETHRAFDCLEWTFGRLHIRTMTEAEADPDAVHLADVVTLRSHVRRLSELLWRSTRKRGAFDTDVFRAAGLLHLLLAVLSGHR
jgi:hypothetical protein